MDFSLNCWIPSLSGFTKIKEFKNSQLLLLSKYILNQDHEGTSECFNYIISENILDKNINLTRFDKWFILCFLRAVNISPALFLKTTNSANIPCNVELSLFDLLTKLSEINSNPQFNILLENITFTVSTSNNLFSVEPVIDSIKTLKINDQVISSFNEIKTLLHSFDNIKNYLAQELVKYDNNSQDYIIHNENKTINLNSIRVHVFDNTLFFFLRSIFLPYCKGLYEKYYNLMKYTKLDFYSINSLTPGESEIFLNLYKQDEESKFQTNEINIQ